MDLSCLGSNGKTPGDEQEQMGMMKAQIFAGTVATMLAAVFVWILFLQGKEFSHLIAIVFSYLAAMYLYMYRYQKKTSMLIVGIIGVIITIVSIVEYFTRV